MDRTAFDQGQERAAPVGGGADRPVEIDAAQAGRARRGQAAEVRAAVASGGLAIAHRAGAAR